MQTHTRTHTFLFSYLPNEGGVVVMLEILREHLISELVVLLYQKGLSILTPADNILVLLILLGKGRN